MKKGPFHPFIFFLIFHASDGHNVVPLEKISRHVNGEERDFQRYLDLRTLAFVLACGVWHRGLHTPGGQPQRMSASPEPLLRDIIQELLPSPFPLRTPKGQGSQAGTSQHPCLRTSVLCQLLISKERLKLLDFDIFKNPFLFYETAWELFRGIPTNTYRRGQAPGEFENHGNNHAINSIGTVLSLFKI